MMDDFLAWPCWVDRQVQRGVNALAFWLMRRGLTKARQHWWSEQAIVAGLMFLSGKYLHRVASGGDWSDAATVMILVAVGSLCLVAAQIALRQDTAAEQGGVATRNDEPAHWYEKVLGLYIAFWPSGMMAFWLAFGIARLYAVYLRATPRSPPPVRVQVPVDAVTHSA